MVSALPPGGTAYPVMQEGCMEAYWMPSGTSIACFRPDGYIYEVPLTFSKGGVRGGASKRISRTRLLETPGRTWSLSRDGRKMVFVAEPPGDSARVINVVLNYRQELERKLTTQSKVTR
jgi:hypothetical protein